MDSNSKEKESKLAAIAVSGRVRSVIIRFVDGVEYVEAISLQMGGFGAYTNTMKLPEKAPRQYCDIGDFVDIEAENSENSPEIISRLYKIRNPTKNFLYTAILLEERSVHAGGCSPKEAKGI